MIKVGLPTTTELAAVAALGMIAATPRAEAQPNGGDRLEEIVVTSSIIATPRRQIGTAVSVLDGEEMQLRGYSGLADALRTQPGIGVSNSGGPGKTTALRIRGEEGYRTLLLIDGVKAIDPTRTQASPSFDSLLVTGDLERVEVLRGPQGFMYGADAGGVVSIVTRSGAGDLGGRVGIELGEFDTRKLDASVAAGSERGDIFVSVTDLQTDGFNSRPEDTVLGDDDGAENTTLHAKLGWNVSEQLRLQFVARDIEAEASFDRCFTADTFELTHDCVAINGQTTYKISADHERGAFRNTFGYSRIDVTSDSLSAGVSTFATDGELSRLEYTGSFEASDATTLVYGLDLQSEAIRGADARERDQNGAYVEYQGNFGDRFYLAAGARYDDNDDFGSHTSSRLSAAYVQELAGGHALKYRASYGTGFRAPSLYEVSYNAGAFAFPPAAGTLLREETSRGYDVGLELDAAAGWHAELTYFDQEIEDEIFFDLDNFSGYLQSFGKSSSTGVELAVQLPLGERWQLLGNWTRNDAKDSSNAQRLRRPKTLGNIGILYAGADEKLRVAANYRLAKDSIDVGGVALDDYEVLDVSMTYSLGATLELYARVQNALDENYQELAGYNAAGRAGYAGVRLRF